MVHMFSSSKGQSKPVWPLNGVSFSTHVKTGTCALVATPSVSPYMPAQALTRTPSTGTVEQREENEPKASEAPARVPSDHLPDRASL